jgi:hypothetical protein
MRVIDVGPSNEDGKTDQAQIDDGTDDANLARNLSNCATIIKPFFRREGGTGRAGKEREISAFKPGTMLAFFEWYGELFQAFRCDWRWSDSHSFNKESRKSTEGTEDHDLGLSSTARLDDAGRNAVDHDDESVEAQADEEEEHTCCCERWCMCSCRKLYYQLRQDFFGKGQSAIHVPQGGEKWPKIWNLVQQWTEDQQKKEERALNKATVEESETTGKKQRKRASELLLLPRNLGTHRKEDALTEMQLLERQCYWHCYKTIVQAKAPE